MKIDLNSNKIQNQDSTTQSTSFQSHRLLSILVIIFYEHLSRCFACKIVKENCPKTSSCIMNWWLKHFKSCVTCSFASQQQRGASRQLLQIIDWMSQLCAIFKVKSLPFFVGRSNSNRMRAVLLHDSTSWGVHDVM